VLLPRTTLDAVVAGDVTLVFRRWRRPTVRTGGRLRTAAGVLAVDSVEVVEPAELREQDARRAGWGSLDELRAWLGDAGEPPVYRITVRYDGPDPRVALRSRADPSAAELAELRDALARLDARSRRPPWTEPLLRLVDARPAVLAADLAALVGRETGSFKADVRKLKELGLTESLRPGYRLSPRGRALIAAIDAERGATGGAPGSRRPGRRSAP
jgi:hypothetical protein